MSKNLPVPLRSGAQHLERPPVVVIDPARTGRRFPTGDSPLARFILNVTPDLLRALDRSMNARRTDRSAPVTGLTPFPGVQDRRTYTSGMQVTEYDVDVRVPFVRRVTVRRASAWSVDTPIVEPDVKRGSRIRRAGVFGLGGAFALAALGILANRAANVAGAGSRRG